MITSKQLAQLCGVSQGTVDRALNDRPGIKAETREKILAAAKAHGYEKNHLASRLSGGRSMLLGLVLFDLAHSFFAELSTEIEREARRLGYSVLIVLTDKNPATEEACIRRLCSMGVDGLILFPVGKGRAMETLLRTCGRPVVTVGNRLSEHFDFVGPDDRQAMKDATLHAIEAGYRHFLYLCPALMKKECQNIYGQERRLLGFQEALQDHPHCTCEILTQKDDPRLFATYDQRTAIFCPSDSYAIRLLRQLDEKKIPVPQRVGILGFDGVFLSEYTRPALTTVEYPMREIGVACVQKLVSAIETGNRQGDSFFAHRLIFRESL